MPSKTATLHQKTKDYLLPQYRLDNDAIIEYNWQVFQDNVDGIVHCLGVIHRMDFTFIVVAPNGEVWGELDFHSKSSIIHGNPGCIEITARRWRDNEPPHMKYLRSDFVSVDQAVRALVQHVQDGRHNRLPR